MGGKLKLGKIPPVVARLIDQPRGHAPRPWIFWRYLVLAFQQRNRIVGLSRATKIRAFRTFANKIIGGVREQRVSVCIGLVQVAG